MQVEQLLSSDNLTKLAYQTFQQSKSIFGVTHKTLSNRLTSWFAPPRNLQPVSNEVLMILQEKLQELQETDWEDSQKGVYPATILFDNPWEDFFLYYPFVWLDMPKIWERITHKQYQSFDKEIDKQGYPKYYLQNFHYQTDGYLGEMSANLYDIQVEILFNGSADAMRRRILAPLKGGLSYFQQVPASQVKVLDIACGTGRTLKFIRATLPKASLFGVDLSATYLRKANELLSQEHGELPQLIRANAEELPYQSNYFHGITSVFLFHELPEEARQNVIEECFRVLQPGGVLVLCDSIQLADSPDFTVMMENFPVMFHEPYYKNYVSDDLVAKLEKAGFEDISTHNHFMSKYWVARKGHIAPTKVRLLR